MARANYAPELQEKMRVDRGATRYRELKAEGGAQGYAVEVQVVGEENGGPTRRYYTVESDNEAGVLTQVTLTKTVGKVGP